MLEHFFEVKIEIKPRFAFSIHLPENYLDQAAVTLMVEFVNGESAHYNVWCQLEGTDIRGLVLTGVVKQDKNDSADTLAEKIIEDMKEQEEILDDSVTNWLAYVHECCSSDPDDDEIDEDDWEGESGANIIEVVKKAFDNAHQMKVMKMFAAAVEEGLSKELIMKIMGLSEEQFQAFSEKIENK